jgi:hypothetical protein
MIGFWNLFGSVIYFFLHFINEITQKQHAHKGKDWTTRISPKEGVPPAAMKYHPSSSLLRKHTLSS